MINVHNISPGKSYVTIYSNQTGSKLCNEKKHQVCAGKTAPKTETATAVN